MGMTGVVVCSDVVDVDGFGDSRHLVEVFDFTPQVRTSNQSRYVAFEVTEIDRIKTNELPSRLDNSTVTHYGAKL